jgi:hypothetical protein
VDSTLPIYPAKLEKGGGIRDKRRGALVVNTSEFDQ